MVDYRKIKFVPSSTSYIGRQAFDQIVEDCAKADAENKNLYQGALVKHEEIVRLVRDLYGSMSNEHKYIRNRPVPKPPSHKSVIDAAKKDYEAGVQAMKRRKQREELKARQNEAIDRLQENGYIYGEHFDRASAIRFASENLILVDGRYLRVDPYPTFPIDLLEVE